MKCDELKVYVPQDGPYGLEPEEGGKLVEEKRLQSYTILVAPDMYGTIVGVKDYSKKNFPWGFGGRNLDGTKCESFHHKEVYLKEDVDKYIKELKGDNERIRGESCKLTDGCLRLKQCRKEKANIADELRHQKRERCLAMAECRDAQARLFHRFGTEVMLNQLYGRNPAVDMKRMDRRSSRCRLASQLWKKRAEEFKEAK